MAFLINEMTLSWAMLSLGLGAFILLLMFIMIIILKMTHAGVELKAKIRGRPIGLMFDDNRTFEMICSPVSAGLIQDEKYGTFIISDKGSYIDRKKKLVMIPLATNIAVNPGARLSKISADLYNLIGDEKKLAELRHSLANGDLEGEDLSKFDAIKESIDFSHFKSFMNAILPHNIEAKINLEVSRRLKSMGMKGGTQFFWYAILGIGLILLAALVLYLVMGGKGGSSTTIIQQAPAVINGTVSRLVG